MKYKEAARALLKEIGKPVRTDDMERICRERGMTAATCRTELRVACFARQIYQDIEKGDASEFVLVAEATIGLRELGAVAMERTPRKEEKPYETYDVSDSHAFCTIAISHMKCIQDDDPERFREVLAVEQWCINYRGGKQDESQ